VTIVIAMEAIVLLLLSLLMVGLLRSHAEILRLLHVGEQGYESETSSRQSPAAQSLAETELASPREVAPRASSVVGETLAGDPIHYAVAGHEDTLLAFLTSTCLVCEDFWAVFSERLKEPVPGGARLIVVTKDRNFESPSRLERLAPSTIPVVMSTAAWDAYEVPLAPYFIYVDALGEVQGEGAARTWEQVVSLLNDVAADVVVAGKQRKRRRERSSDRVERVEGELAAAGIGPGHPSLYSDDASEGGG
jgi:hypothetical protein